MVLGLREIIHQYKKNGRLVNNSDIAIKKTSELDKNSCGTKEGEGDHHDLQFASDPSACDASQPRKRFCWRGFQYRGVRNDSFRREHARRAATRTGEYFFT